MARVGVGSVRFVAASLAVVLGASATAGCCSLARKLTGGAGQADAARDETVRRARAAGGDVDVAALPGDHLSALAAEMSQSIAFFRSLSAAPRPDAGNPVP